MTLSFGSLFAGIGGIDLGLERSGMVCKWQVEIDDYCNRVLAKHWPNVPRHCDVRSVGAHNLSAVDLIAGGFPCQDISDAGKRAGIDGARSGLWVEFARILSELRPRYALLENVAALLHRGLGRILGDLAAIGYDAEWHCIPAAAIGAPHRRDRIFIIAYDDRLGQPRARLHLRSGRQEQAAPVACGSSAIVADAPSGGWGEDVKRLTSPRCPAGSALALRRPDSPDVSDANRIDGRPGKEQSRGQWIFDGCEVGNSGWWAIEPDVGRVAHGIPNRVDRLRGLGNSVVPQVAEFIGRQIVAHQEHHHG